MLSNKRSFINSINSEFVYIKPGSFRMGVPKGTMFRNPREKEAKIKLTKGFYIQTAEVTIEQFRQYLNETKNTKGVNFDDDGCPLLGESDFPYSYSEFGTSKDQPMVFIDWYAADSFAKWLSDKEGKIYRLPTDAEWEYAARGGSSTLYPWGNEPDCSKANFGTFYDNECKDKNPGCTTEVMSYPANQFGLYDMIGNVCEWCVNWETVYRDNSVDPVFPQSGKFKEIRGGAWRYMAAYSRCGSRNKGVPTSSGSFLGFRLVCVGM